MRALVSILALVCLAWIEKCMWLFSSQIFHGKNMSSNASWEAFFLGGGGILFFVLEKDSCVSFLGVLSVGLAIIFFLWVQ